MSSRQRQLQGCELRDGYPMSFWGIYLTPLQYLSSSVYHYALAVSIYRNAEPSPA